MGDYLMQTCARCLVQFDNWSQYNTHLITKTCYLSLKPIKTSQRTKKQITHDLEAKLGETHFMGFSGGPVKAPEKALPQPKVYKFEDAYLEMIRNLKGGK